MALFSALKQTHCTRMWFDRVTSCLWCVFEYPPKWCTYSAGMAGATWNCCHLGAFYVHHTTMHHGILCTPYNHAPCHIMQSRICKVYACLAVTCHLRFWQSDRGLLHAAAVTWGWNGYRNKRRHRKLTLEKKIPPPPPPCSSRDSVPQPFNQESGWHSNHWAIPTPHLTVTWPWVHIFRVFVCEFSASRLRPNHVLSFSYLVFLC